MDMDFATKKQMWIFRPGFSNILIAWWDFYNGTVGKLRTDKENSSQSLYYEQVYLIIM